MFLVTGCDTQKKLDHPFFCVCVDEFHLRWSWSHLLQHWNRQGIFFSLPLFYLPCLILVIDILTEKLTVNWEWSNSICALGQRGRVWDYKISYAVYHLPFPGEGVATVERFPSTKFILKTSLHVGKMAASVGTVPPWDEHRWRIKSLNLSSESAPLLSRRQLSTSMPQ